LFFYYNVIMKVPVGKTIVAVILPFLVITGISINIFPQTIIELSNSSFEAGLSSWNVNSAPNAEYSVDTAVSHIGSRSIRIICHSPTTKAFIWQANPQQQRITPGKSYTFWVWVKTEDVRKAVDVGDSYGAALCIAWGNFYLTTLYRADWIEGPIGTHDWVRISTTVVAPNRAERVQVGLFLHLATGKVWFDDVNSGDITPPPAPSLLFPKNNGIVSSLPIIFDWSDVEDVNNQSPPVIYELQIDDNENFISPVVNLKNLTSSEYTTLLSNGTYWWRVRAKDSAANYSSWTSPPWTVKVNVSTNADPIVLQLQNSSFELGLTYWVEHTTSCATYSVDRTVAHTGTSSAKIQSTSCHCSEAHIWQASTVNSIIPGQSYKFWTWVKTEDVVKEATSTSHGAALRILWSDNYFQTRYREDWVVGSTGTTDWAKLEAILVAPIGAERVQVALFLHNAAGAVWFDDVNTKLVYIDTVPPTAPSLLSPQDNYVVSSLPINFDWSDVTDSSLPVTYELQVDNDMYFLSPEISLAPIPTSYYTLQSLPNGTYWWRVRAIDGANNRSAWSVVYKLVVNIAVPFSIDYIMEVRPNFVFKNTTDRVSLKYYVPASGKVRIRVYSLSGKLVKEIVNIYKETGVYEDSWDLHDDTGMGVPSGVYLIHYFLSGVTQKVEKIVYIK